MNEAETRAEHIDPALAAAGSGVVDGGLAFVGNTRSRSAGLKGWVAGAIN